MTISLIRHGRPAVDYRTRLSGLEFGSWLDAYEIADVDARFPPPTSLGRALCDCRLIVTSCSPRSVQSADMLGVRSRRVALEDAREAALPRRVVCLLPLRPLPLTVLARLLWVFGFLRCSESKHEATARAERFAATLEALAEEFGHVAVIGHGYFHRFCSQALQTLGWSCTCAGRGYWSLSEFKKPEQPNKAPEPTPGSVTPRATEGVSK